MGAWDVRQRGNRSGIWGGLDCYFQSNFWTFRKWRTTRQGMLPLLPLFMDKRWGLMPKYCDKTILGFSSLGTLWPQGGCGGGATLPHSFHPGRYSSLIHSLYVFHTFTGGRRNWEREGAGLQRGWNWGIKIPNTLLLAFFLGTISPSNTWKKSFLPGLMFPVKNKVQNSWKPHSDKNAGNFLRKV